MHCVAAVWHQRTQIKLEVQHMLKHAGRGFACLKDVPWGLAPVQLQAQEVPPEAHHSRRYWAVNRSRGQASRRASLHEVHGIVHCITPS